MNRVTGQQIDKENQNIPDYRSGIKRFLDCLISSSEGVIPAIEEIQRVGYKATLSKNHFGVHELTDEVVRGMRQWLPLARLHNTAYIETIRTMREALPDALFLGAFETGFHREIPLERKLYGVPYEWYEKYGVQRLGYHSASHGYIADVLNEKSGTYRAIERVRIPPCNLSSTNSAYLDSSAVRNPVSPSSLKTAIPLISQIS